ncbi:hypothetical protein [Treponema sp.]|uniref:hypothetical protein n=1 Tax=Treponema sp. TaxID=166 RepID=UPI0025D89AB9|nr:hypothetical protein [Treponema sp.]
MKARLAKICPLLPFAFLLSLLLVSCCGEKVRLKKSYTSAEELQKDIVSAVSEQYGMLFEIGKGLGGSDATVGVHSKDYGFYGYLRPANISESYKKYNIYTDYTVADDVYFETQAHVRMFEKQLRTDVEKILNDIGISFDILEFRGMSRNINKWSKNSTYAQYKTSKDYETWIYIKLPNQQNNDYDYNKKYYAPLVLPMVKKIYSALEPEFNVTLIFYIEKYEQDITVGSAGEIKNVHEIMENPDVVWHDLSKFNNYLDWTEQDIEDEVNIVNEDFFITAWKKANGIE